LVVVVGFDKLRVTELSSKFYFVTGLNILNERFSWMFFNRIFRHSDIRGLDLRLLVLYIENFLDDFFKRYDFFSDYFNFFVVVLFDDFVFLNDDFLWDLNNFVDCNFFFNSVGHVNDLFNNLFVDLFNILVTFVFDNLFFGDDVFNENFLLNINFFIDWSFDDLFNNNFLNDLALLFACLDGYHYLFMHLFRSLLISLAHFPLNEQVCVVSTEWLMKNPNLFIPFHISLLSRSVILNLFVVDVYPLAFFAGPNLVSVSMFFKHNFFDEVPFFIALALELS